ICIRNTRSKRDWSSDVCSSDLQHFIDLGFPVVDADIIAHHLLDKNTPAYKEVVKVFGSEILQENGEINRQALGALVFNHPDKLRSEERRVGNSSRTQTS